MEARREALEAAAVAWKEKPAAEAVLEAERAEARVAAAKVGAAKVGVAAKVEVMVVVEEPAGRRQARQEDRTEEAAKAVVAWAAVATAEAAEREEAVLAAGAMG